MTQKEAKKKKRIRLTSAVLLSILVVSVVCVVGSAPFVSGSPVGVGSLEEADLDPNSYATLLGGRLLDSFYTTLPNGTGVLNYPVEYAGAYIDQSNNLHILLSKYASNATIEAYQSIIGDPDVIFETKEFPLSRLYEVQDALDGVMISFDIDASGVDEITNRLELNLENSTKQSEIIEYLDNQIVDFDSRCITFLGPNPVTASGAEYTQPSASPNDGFLGTNMSLIYGAVAVAVIAVTAALACCLAFVRRGAKPQPVSATS